MIKGTGADALFGGAGRDILAVTAGFPDGRDSFAEAGGRPVRVQILAGKHPTRWRWTVVSDWRALTLTQEGADTNTGVGVLLHGGDVADLSGRDLLIYRGPAAIRLMTGWDYAV